MKNNDAILSSTFYRRLLLISIVFFGSMIVTLVMASTASAACLKPPIAVVGQTGACTDNDATDDTDGPGIPTPSDGEPGGSGGGGTRGEELNTTGTCGGGACSWFAYRNIDNRAPRKADIEPEAYAFSKTHCVKPDDIGSYVQITRFTDAKGNTGYVTTMLIRCIQLQYVKDTVQCYTHFGDKAQVKTNIEGVVTTKKYAIQNLAWAKTKTIAACKKSWDQQATLSISPDEFAKYKLTIGVYGQNVNIKVYAPDPFTGKVKASKIIGSPGATKRLALNENFSYYACDTSSKLTSLTASQYDNFDLDRLDGDACRTETPSCTVPDLVTVNGEEVKKPSKKTITAFRDGDENSVSFEKPVLRSNNIVSIQKQSTKLKRSGTPWKDGLSAKKNYVELNAANGSEPTSVSGSGLTFNKKAILDYELAALMASDGGKPTTLQNVIDMTVKQTRTVPVVKSYSPKTGELTMGTKTSEVVMRFSCESPKVNLNFVRGVNAF